MTASTKLTVPVTAEQVQALRFTPVRIREGYSLGEVDAFLDRVIARLSGTGDLTSDEVRKVRFTPVRWREGYDMGEVDAAMDAITATLDQSR